MGGLVRCQQKRGADLANETGTTKGMVGGGGNGVIYALLYLEIERIILHLFKYIIA